jgi:hypothetical protein
MNRSYLTKILTCPLALLVSCLPAAQAQSASVPSQYTTEYAQLDQAVDTFITSLDSRTQLTSAPVIGSGLDTADGGKGTALLTSTALQNMQTQVKCYSQLGIPAVTVSIGFPLACQEFWTQQMGAPSDLKQMLSFYQQVVKQCHKAGIKVLVEAHPVYPDGTNAIGPNAYAFASLATPTQFQNYFAEHVYNIASSVQPDVISIVAEPGTDLAWTNQPAYSGAQNLGPFVQVMANQITSANSLNHTKIVAAAGAPSWDQYAQNYNNQFFKVNGLGAIDIHTYFAGGNDLALATSLADSARAAGKAIVASECWLSKAGTGSPPAKPEPNQAGIDRAIASFSFWEPLDEKYLSAFQQWCKVENPTMFCFSYPQQLFAYLNYNSESSLPDPQIIANELQAATQAMNADQFSPVGTYFGKSIR